MGVTVSIPESVLLLADVRKALEKHPALSPISTGAMVELPCCGTRVDFEAIDCSQDGPSRVFWPPRWTCLQCDQTFTPSATGDDVTEVVKLPSVHDDRVERYPGSYGDEGLAHD